MNKVTIIGAGLAGSEAAWQLATRGVSVKLIEMRPAKMTKAHKTAQCAELVCSNSLRGAALSNAVGLLKEELRRAGSLIMQSADTAQVPAGGALAVDREKFSALVDSAIREHPLIEFVTEEVTAIPEFSRAAPVIVATGPLTSSALAKAVAEFLGTGALAFFDAISPIIVGSSIDLSQVFRQSRYDKGEGADYLNVPLNKEQYTQFIEAVRTAEKFGGHEEVESDAIGELRPFEGCMPIEDMVARGEDTLRFGPMKPTGLRDPKTGARPYAVVQLRQDDSAAKLWSFVGFQTRMKHGEQERVLRSLPGLEQIEFVRLGSVHRNTFIDSPKCLGPTLEHRQQQGLFFAGQITGVEGYVESTAGGLVAGLNCWRVLSGEAPLEFPQATAMGSLLNYISDTSRTQFQPMNISFGLMPTYLAAIEGAHKKSKRELRVKIAEQALECLGEFLKSNEIAEGDIFKNLAGNLL